jgi:hypothetical protein
MRSLRDKILNFFRRLRFLFRKKPHKITPQEASQTTFTMPMPAPRNAPVAKRNGTRMGKGRDRFFVPASSKQKHPLHKMHFGTFSPIKPINPGRRFK